MDARAARGIAANVRQIAESTALMTLIDVGITPANVGDKHEARAQALAALERAEGAIMQWFMQPMTYR